MDIVDFPKRLMINVSTIVHAALYQDESGAALTACGMVYPIKNPTFMLPGKREKLPQIVDEGEITCKSCLRKLNIEKPTTITQICERYVIVDKKSSLFYEYSQDIKSKIWIASVFNSSWFFTEKMARMVLLDTWYERKKGKKRISKENYDNLSDDEKKKYIYMRTFNDKKYEVKKLDMSALITPLQKTIK